MKKLVILMSFLFIVAMVAGCVESSTPEATPMSTPTPTPTPTPTSTSKVTLTPEQVEQLRNTKDECPYCTHDYDYWIIILEIDGELWWVCNGRFNEAVPEDERCTYMRKVTEKEILRLNSTRFWV